MARGAWNVLTTFLVVMLLAAPLAARRPAKSEKAITQANIYSPVTLAGKQLKPGEYRIAANDSKVTLAIDGKVVVEAPVEWKDETTKPKSSTIEVTAGQVIAIHFAGKMRYVAIVP